jgi:hypothetical protein
MNLRAIFCIAVDAGWQRFCTLASRFSGSFSYCAPRSTTSRLAIPRSCFDRTVVDVSRGETLCQLLERSSPAIERIVMSRRDCRLTRCGQHHSARDPERASERLERSAALQVQAVEADDQPIVQRRVEGFSLSQAVTGLTVRSTRNPASLICSTDSLSLASMNRMLMAIKRGLVNHGRTFQLEFSRLNLGAFE